MTEFPRHFPQIGILSNYVDQFPHLGNLLTRKESYETGWKKWMHRWWQILQIDLGHGADPSVAKKVQSIKDESGPYAIKNHRIVEWVVMEVFRSILSPNNKESPWLVEYDLWLSHFIDDLCHHVDMILRAKTHAWVYYFSIDLTLGVQKIAEKILAHSTWQYDDIRPGIQIWRKSLRMPHLIAYAHGDTAEGLTKLLDRATEMKKLKSRSEVQDGIRTIDQHLDTPLFPQIIIASPDARNLTIQTPHHREIIRDFTTRLGAERYESTRRIIDTNL